MAKIGKLDDAAEGVKVVGRFLGGLFGRGKADDAARATSRAADDLDDIWGPVAAPRTAPRAAASTATGAAQTAPAAAAAAKTYPIRGSWPVRAVFGKPGRGFKATAKTAAGRSLGYGTGIGALGLAYGQLRGNEPTNVGGEIESLGLGLASPYDLRMQRLSQAYGTAENQMVAQEQALQRMLADSYNAEQDQRRFLQNYGANTVRDIGQSYDRSAQEALRAAQEIERGGMMAREGITQEGAATAAALQALAEQPAQAGTGMFTGLVPVTGDLADAPMAASNAAGIAAEATQRGVNITRDDLRAAAAMAPMISQAYGRQVDSDTAMAMAMAQIAGQKERAQTEYQETARIGDRRVEMALAMAEQEDALLAEALAAVAPDQLQLLLGRYEQLVDSENGAQALAARGITSFSDYLEATVGRQTLDRLREIAGLGTGG